MLGLSELTWAATGLAVLSFLMMPVCDRAPIRAVLIVTVSAACALWHIQSRPVVRSPVEHIAWSFAMLSCGWAFACVAVESLRIGRRRSPDVSPPILKLARMAAVLYGVTSGVILLVLLMMRSAYVVAELINGGPGIGGLTASFTQDGLWSLLFLFAGAGVSLIAGRDRRLGVCVFALGSMGIAWLCLLDAQFIANEKGGFERTGGLLWLLLGQSLWIFAATMVGSVRGKAPLLNRSGGGSDGRFPVPQRSCEQAAAYGWRWCQDALAMVLLVSMCYHIVVPTRAVGYGYTTSALLSAVAALLVSVSCCVLVRRSWSELTAGVGLGHLSLAICAAATLIVPRGRVPLIELYPAMFSAMIIGFCLAAGLCALIALRGSTHRTRDAMALPFAVDSHVMTRPDRGDLRSICETEAQARFEPSGDSIMGKLAPVARRFAFLNVSLAFLIGIMMTMWPRMPAVATMDDSLARVAAGLSAILFLLLVVLWCGRRLRQPVFHVMSVLTVLLAGGFLIVRILPFSSHVG